MSDYKTLAKAIALANSDDSFKAALLANPADALAQHGFTAPDGVNVHIIEEGAAVPASSNTDIYLQLGKVGSTATVELSEEALAAVAGGGSCSTTAGTALTIPSCVSCASSASTKC